MAEERAFAGDIEIVKGEEMIRNGDGCLVPVSRLRPDVVLTDQVTRSIVRKMRELAEHNARVKREIFEEVQAYQELMFERYRAKLGGRRGGLTISSFNDLQRVTLQTTDYSRVTAALPAAQALMNEILDDLTGNVGADIRTLIMAAFERDEKTGRVNVQRLNGLKKYSLDHPKWPDFIMAINDAIEPAGSKESVRAYARSSHTDEPQQIVVDFSRLGAV
ncbi:MAG: DUF3164 family protein [Acetobacter sp.]|uniref:DUF3164 family protein n=1 Tax=Acetobacter sp. TaxID=440 RepID=UPI0039E96F24